MSATGIAIEIIASAMIGWLVTCIIFFRDIRICAIGISLLIAAFAAVLGAYWFVAAWCFVALLLAALRAERKAVGR